LIVGVCDDDYVRQYKSKDPVINETDRVRIVKALKCVDDAYIIDDHITVDKVKA
jgi:glycerol-3-phosphate cytidylyltransferase